MTNNASRGMYAAFTSLRLRAVPARNRPWISPMCQYSVYKEDRVAPDWYARPWRAPGPRPVVCFQARSIRAGGQHAGSFL